MPSKINPAHNYQDWTGRVIGHVTVLERGPNDAHGSVQWWVKNALNVNPDEAYLLSRRTLWRKCTGRRPRIGDGFQKRYAAVYRSVINHFKWVYNPHNPARYHGYKGMPAYEPWNPANGSLAIAKAVRDILAEIGDKPGRDYNLHIVDKRIGFWPGNLMWIPVVAHKRAEMLNQLIEENHRLHEEIALLRGDQ